MRVTEAAISHRTTVLVLAMMLAILGSMSYATLPREASPDITIPVVLVTVPYIGVTPEDIETLVTQPLERELKELKDVKVMRSSSVEGASVVTIEFNPGVDIEDALQKVRDKVDKAKPDLPSDSEDPVIQEIAFSDFPIIIAVLYGNLGQRQLKELGEALQDKLEEIPGVLEVKLSGGVEREVQVLADPHRLAFYELTVDDLINAVAGENLSMPGGKVDVGTASFQVRVPGEYEDLSLLADIVVKEKGGAPVFLRDVARVEDGFAERETYARFNGLDSISLNISKRAGENIIRITDEVKERSNAFLEEKAPPGTQVAFISDQSRDIRAMVKELENNILSGLFLVILVLFMALKLRNSFIVALAIPGAMFVTFMTLDVLGITLNMIVLFSLILALGMLVDNAIVIVENIYRHGQEGKDRITAARIGTAEVAWPVATSTLTTVCAFGPLVFWPGIIGEFMSFLPKTLIISLFASLFVALIINPVVCAAVLKGGKTRARIEDQSHQELNVVLRGYWHVVRFAVRHYVVMALLAVGTLIGTVFAYGALGSGVEFFPDTTPRRAFIAVEGPEGSRLDTTDQVARRIEAVLTQQENVESYVTTVGETGGQQMGPSGGGSAPHAASINVDFPDVEKQLEDGRITIARIRDAAQGFPGYRVEIQKEEGGPPTGAPVAVEILGERFDELGRLSKQTMKLIEGVEGLVDLKDDYRVGRPELRIEVKRDAAQLAGSRTRQLASSLRTAVAGTKASVVRELDDEYDIVVRLAPEYRDEISDIETLLVGGRDGMPVPLRNIARVVPAAGSGTIRHKDGERLVTISAEVSGANDAEVRDEVMAIIDESLEMPPGYSYRLAGQDQEQDEAQAFLSRAFLIALFLIFMVLVTQFNSLLLPGIILISVVLSLIGVMWGLIITKTPFGIIMTGLGVISLAGVVVNNAIVLIDYVEQLRARGLNVQEALVRAGLVRLRPVLLTAVTTVLGLLPMATGWGWDFTQMQVLEPGQSTQWWKPMAVAVIFGLVVATVLTLVVVPSLYALFDAIRSLMGRIFKRVAPEPEPQPSDA